MVLSPLASAAVFAFEGAVSPGRLGYLDPVQTAGMGVFGLIFGLVSLAYVIPLLLKTDVRKSLSTVYAGTLAAGIVGLMQMPIVAFVLMGGTHVAVCIASARMFKRKPRAVSICAFCGYSLSGLESSKCPECGRESACKAPQHN